MKLATVVDDAIGFVAECSYKESKELVKLDDETHLNIKALEVSKEKIDNTITNNRFFERLVKPFDNMDYLKL